MIDYTLQVQTEKVIFITLGILGCVCLSLTAFLSCWMCQNRGVGVSYYGTTSLPMPEALEQLSADGIMIDTCRIRAFQFGDEVIYVKISPSIETLVDQQPESLSSLDDVRHMLEPYSEDDGHTLAMSGVIIDE